jgi:hypothetical protein
MLIMVDALGSRRCQSSARLTVLRRAVTSVWNEQQVLGETSEERGL